MNHDVQAHIQGTAKAAGQIGLHMNAHLNIVVPLSATFAPPARQMTVDSSKVSVVKKG